MMIAKDIDSIPNSTFVKNGTQIKLEDTGHTFTLVGDIWYQDKLETPKQLQEAYELARAVLERPLAFYGKKIQL